MPAISRPIGTRSISRRSAIALAGGTVAIPTLGIPNVSRAQTTRAAERTLRFVPYANLVVMDPVWAYPLSASNMPT